jgi:predicted aconitase with swiveling domain
MISGCMTGCRCRRGESDRKPNISSESQDEIKADSFMGEMQDLKDASKIIKYMGGIDEHNIQKGTDQSHHSGSGRLVQGKIVMISSEF